MNPWKVTIRVLIALNLLLLLGSVATADQAKKPHAVIVVGTLHYSPELTIPMFAKELGRFGFRTTIEMGDEVPECGDLPGGEANWLPAYSKVNGELPIEDLPQGDRVFARGFVNVLEAGRMKLEINQNDGLRLWIDGAPVKDLETAINLARGRHTLTVALDRERRRVGLRVELKAADNVVKFKPEGGP